MGSDLDPGRARSRRFQPPNARSSRSAGRWRSSRTLSFSTSRPRRFPKPTSSACSRRCGGLRANNIGDRLRHPPSGRGAAHRRPSDRPSRRTPAGDGRGERNQRGRTGADDRRPLDERRLRETRAAFRAQRVLGCGTRRRTCGSRFILGRGGRNPWARRLARRRAITRSGARSSARRRHDRRTPHARRRADRALKPGGGDGQGRRLRIEQAGRGGRRLEPGRAREHLSESGGERPRSAGIRPPRDGARRSSRPPFSASPSRRPASRSRSRRFLAAISRRWSSRAGWRPM